MIGVQVQNSVSPGAVWPLPLAADHPLKPGQGGLSLACRSEITSLMFHCYRSLHAPQSVLRVSLLLTFLAFCACCHVCQSALAAPDPDRQAPIRPSQVKLAGWLQPRLIRNERSRLLAVDEGALIEGFRNRPGKQEWIGEHVGKWLHASSLAWAYTGDPKLLAKMERVESRLLLAQLPDGYLGTYLDKDRWTSWDVWVHKYDLIGLLAYYERTGDVAALDAARKIGNLLVSTFGPGKRDIIASGTHMGMAATSVLEPMVLLYRATGDAQYLDFARYLVHSWDQPNGPQIIRSLMSTHSVARTANGKAYELMSNLVGLCELARATSNLSLIRPVLTAWRDIVANRMYITGGTSYGEYFQKDHYLPNEGDVSETCATVTWLQLNIQLLELTGEPIFADVAEKIIYNHLLAAQHPYKATFCYFTPLAGRKAYGPGLNCCVSSGPRGIALIPTIAYTLTRSGVCVNLYNSGMASLRLRSGRSLQIHQQTLYPMDGGVLLTIEPSGPTRFSLALRIPSWCPSATVQVNGGPKVNATPGRYHVISRIWRPGDRVALRMAMPATLVRGTYGNAGLVAIRRGPLVLCADEDLNPKLRPIALAGLGADAAAKLRRSRITGTGEVRPNVFAAPGFMLQRAPDGSVRRVPRTVYLVDFASAGAGGGRYSVWLRSPTAKSVPRMSLLAYGRESYSRQGNVNGSIADEDPGTWRVTYNGGRAAEDWYAVTATAAPVLVGRVLFMHGFSYHDGGWFDTSAGKPKVQVQTQLNGPWHTVATLDTYPATTATDSKALLPGQAFEAVFAPVRALSVRVVGKPACGDRPSQAFSSCAELQAFGR